MEKLLQAYGLEVLTPWSPTSTVLYPTPSPLPPHLLQPLPTLFPVILSLLSGYVVQGTWSSGTTAHPVLEDGGKAVGK